MIQRAAYRFAVVYLGLFCVASQFAGGLLLFPGGQFPALGTIRPMRDITNWLGTHVFHVTTLAYQGVSADTPFHWVQLAWLLVASAAAASVVSGFSRTDDVVAKWARLFFRFALAAQMFYFGMAKVIPTQFPPPSLVTLLKPVGNLSPDDLLWTFIGASTPYQMFTGWAEVIAGLLLIAPQTATLGALIALADMVQVFVLNLSYDVGLKQTSSHLVLIALFLLAPDAKRLAGAFMGNGQKTSRRSLAIQIAFGVYLLLMFTRLAMLSWQNPGGPGAPTSALYGIWDIERLSVDGEFKPPMFNDYDRRWRRVVFDTPDLMIFQRLDDSFAHYGAAIDVDRHQIALRKIQSRQWKASFTFDRRGDDEMVLDGEMDGHTLHVELQLLHMDVFRLTNGSFRWVRPPG